MTAFITHCWKSARPDVLALLLGAWLAAFGALPARAEPTAAEVTQLRLERSADGLLLSAALDFKLPASVEEALLKGVPVIFVAEAEVLRERWYWMDKKVAGAARHMRLSYHPLTRRWRLAQASGAINGDGAGVALNLTFDALEEALATVKRLSNWRVADWGALDAEARHQIEFRFRLDVAQLPRPMQIGVLGQSDWNIAASVTRKFVPGELK